MPSVSASTSTKTGVAPTFTTALAVAMKLVAHRDHLVAGTDPERRAARARAPPCRSTPRRRARPEGRRGELGLERRHLGAHETQPERMTRATAAILLRPEIGLTIGIIVHADTPQCSAPS